MSAADPWASSDENLAAVVEHYVRKFRSVERKELKFYRSRKSLEDAIQCAAMALRSNSKRHLHQCRIAEATLTQFRRRLSKQAGVICKANDFEELYRRVEEVADAVKGIGPLTIYDTTHRIGAIVETTSDS